METQHNSTPNKSTSGSAGDVTDSPKISKKQYECYRCHILFNNMSALVKPKVGRQGESAGNKEHTALEFSIPKAILNDFTPLLIQEAQEDILGDAILSAENIKQECEMEIDPGDAIWTSQAVSSCPDKTNMKQPADRHGAAFQNGNNAVQVLSARVYSLEKTVLRQTKAFNEMKDLFEKVLLQIGAGNTEFDTIGASDLLNGQNYTFQLLQTAADLASLEEKLHDSQFKAWLSRHLEPICGKSGRSDGKNCAYRLVDHIFSRQLLANCSLLGGTKRNNGRYITNISIKHHKKVYELFLELIRKADSTFTLQNQDEFFEVILKNKKARLAAVAKCKAAAMKATRRKKRPTNLLYKKRRLGTPEEETSDGSNLTNSKSNSHHGGSSRILPPLIDDNSELLLPQPIEIKTEYEDTDSSD